MQLLVRYGLIGGASLLIGVSLIWLQPPAHGSTTALPTHPTAMCQANGRVWDLLVYEDVVYLAGEFTAVRPANKPANDPSVVARSGLAACAAATGEILPWAPQLTHTVAAELVVEALALSPDQTALYFGGRFSTVNSVTRKNAAAVGRTDGALTAWNPQPGKVSDLLLNRAGTTAYLAGSSGVAAYATSGGGAKISTFAPLLTTANGQSSSARALALSPDEAVLYIGGGPFTQVNGVAQAGAAAVDSATGQVTQPFHPDIVDPKPDDLVAQVHEIRIGDNAIYLCGDWWLTEGGAAAGGWGEANPNGRQANVGRFDPITGKADLTWRPWTDGGVQACDLDLVNHALLVGGHFDKFGGPEQQVTDVPLRKGLAALDLTTGNPLAWQPVLALDNGGNAEAWALEVAAGRLAVGGWFERIDALNQSGLSSFDLQRRALLVVDNPTALRGGDPVVYDRLTQGLGFQVQLADDHTVPGSAADGVDLLAVSATASSTVLQTRFKQTATSALIWRPWLYDEMGMTLPAESEQGALEGRTATISNPAHALAAGRTGVITLTTGIRTISWGNPLPSALVIAQMADSTSTTGQRAVHFAYPRGAALADGAPAPGCRLGLPAYEGTALAYTAAAWVLFDQAVLWSLNCPTVAQATATPTAPATATATPTRSVTPTPAGKPLYLPQVISNN